MNRKRNAIIAIAVSAAAGFLALQTVSAPKPDSAPPTLAAAEAVVTEPPTPETCAYVWAYHDAPELTEKLNTAVQAINPAASASAQLFGEDCAYADGHSTFGAMETDFYIHLPVENLTDEETLGNWMAQTLPIVAEIPRGEIQGNYGFVEFWFEKSEAEHVIVRVPIQKYMNEAQEKTGAELFQIFSKAP